MGKRSANAIKAGAPTTPTTNALNDEADQEDAVRSTYKRQGQGQQRPQGRHTPVKPNKPHHETSRPGETEHPEGPARHVQLLRPVRAWHRIKDTGNNAPPSARHVNRVADRTTTLNYAGKPLKWRAPSTSRYMTLPKAYSPTRRGTSHPNHGHRDGHHHSQR